MAYLCHLTGDVPSKCLGLEVKTVVSFKVPFTEVTKTLLVDEGGLLYQLVTGSADPIQVPFTGKVRDIQLSSSGSVLYLLTLDGWLYQAEVSSDLKLTEKDVVMKRVVSIAPASRDSHGIRVKYNHGGLITILGYSEKKKLEWYYEVNPEKEKTSISHLDDAGRTSGSVPIPPELKNFQFASPCSEFEGQIVMVLNDQLALLGISVSVYTMKEPITEVYGGSSLKVVCGKSLYEKVGEEFLPKTFSLEVETPYINYRIRGGLTVRKKRQVIPVTKIKVKRVFPISQDLLVWTC
jgi:hypothetical protein